MKTRFEQLVEDSQMNYNGGVYISVDVYHDSDTLQSIQHYMRDLFDVGIDLYGLHTTLIYSKKPMPNLDGASLKLNPKKFFTATIKEITTWKDTDNNRYLGILLNSSELEDEYKRLMKFGFVSDYETYMPHITLAYNTSIDHHDDTYKELFERINKKFANNPKCVLQLTNEHIEPLDEEWS